MSRYSNVSAESLKSAIDSALNELENYNFTVIKNNLVNTSVLRSSVVENIHVSFNELISSSKVGSIQTLKNNLNTLKSACDNIIKIQTLEKEIDALNQEIAILESRKYKTEIHVDIDKYGNRNEYTTKTLDYGVVNQINAKNQSIALNKNMITTLEKETDSLLSH